MRFESPSSSEVWKPVRGYEGLYEVSNTGRVRALFSNSNFQKVGRILKPWITRNGYCQIHLMRPGQKPKGKCIHTLMLEAFVGPAPEKCEARHLNGVRHDNRCENLAWGTHKENSEDSRRHGTMATGERQGASKLTEIEVRTLRELWFRGIKTGVLAKMFSIDRTNVWQICTFKSWRTV